LFWIGEPIEKELLSEDNINESEQFICGVKDAYSRSNTQTLHLSVSKKYKEIYKIIPKELGIETSRWTDRIILTWINRNKEIIKLFIEKIEKVFEYRIDESV
jgi:hypothetical protein